MSDLAAPSEGSTQTPPAAPSTPTPPSPVFADSGTPEWVKTAGLQEAHTKGNVVPPVETATPATATTTAVPPPVVSPTTTATAPTAQPAPLSIDHAALARAIREGNTPVPTGPSDEQLAQQLGIVTVTPQMYKSVFGVDGTPEQVAGLNDYGQNIAKQAVTIAKVLFDKEIKDLRDSFQPYTEVIKNQERDRIKGEFFKKHSDLAGYEAVVTQQYQLAMASGRKFDSIEAAGTFVADQTRSHLTSLGIKIPVAGAAPNGTPSSGKAAPQSRSMAPLSTGGKGSGTPPATGAKTAAASVWGD